jgi:peptidoglycan/LPS O-acetylase OafA/YrhL
LKSIPHSPPLDGLRGLAILLVILHNADAFTDTGAAGVLAVVSNAGWVGVQLFFALSGFLITGNLLATLGASNYYSGFFARRALRIFPLYFLALAALLLVLPGVVTLSPDILATYQRQGPLWLFLNNWFQPFEGAVYWFPHFWSLAVEEQFYLVWPFALAMVRPRGRIAFLVGIAVLALLFRIAALAMGAPTDVPYMTTVCRMDALALGGLAAVIFQDPALGDACARRGPLLWSASFALLIVGAATTGVYDIRDPGTITSGYSILAVAFSMMVLVAVSGGKSAVDAAFGRVLAFAPLRSVGRYSYGIYVFHLPMKLAAGHAVLGWFRGFGVAGSLLYVISLAAASYMLAVSSFHLLERRFLDLRRFVLPKPVLAAGR